MKLKGKVTKNDLVRSGLDDLSSVNNPKKEQNGNSYQQQLRIIIGPEHFIKCVAAFHQYNELCIYGPLQEAIADALEQYLKCYYFQDFNKKLKEDHTRLGKELVSFPINFNIYIFEGDCTILADISKIEVPKSYYTNPESYSPYNKDYVFYFWLCKEKGVVALPCSAFYSKQYAHIGQNLVRIAILKTKETLIEAGKRMGSILYKQN